VHYRPVVDQVIQAHPLDPLAAIFFVAVFVVVALLAARRPVYGLCALVLVIPFAFYRDTLGTTITLPKIVLLGTILGLTTYAGAFAYLRERAAIRFLVAGGAVLAMMALSIAQAGVLPPAIREVLKMLEYLALFATAYTCYRLDPDTRLIQRAIALTVALVSAVALLQEFLGAPSALHFNGTIIPRIAGPIEGPNQLAGYLEISIALLAAFTCTMPSREIGIALSLAIFADILTFSRAGLVASLLALIVISILYRRAAIALIRPLVAGICMGGIVAGFWAMIPHWLGIFRIPPYETTNYAGGVGTRSQLWVAALKLWHRHPLFGVGAGNFELDLPQAGLYGIRTHANSLYLQALVEGGIPLFLATLYLLWTSIATFARRASTSPFIAGAFAASIALAFHQLFDLLIFYPKVGEWWWLALALGAAQLQPYIVSGRRLI
jgi:O-antigen ligase